MPQLANARPARKTRFQGGTFGASKFQFIIRSTAHVLRCRVYHGRRAEFQFLTGYFNTAKHVDSASEPDTEDGEIDHLNGQAISDGESEDAAPPSPPRSPPPVVVVDEHTILPLPYCLPSLYLNPYPTLPYILYLHDNCNTAPLH
jgi:hypothetical protein